MMKQLGAQGLGLIGVSVWSLVISWVTIKIVNHTIGLRVYEEDEIEGLESPLTVSVST